MFLISIPKPCHENWDEMSPRQQGAFCGVCSKTVVDFTSLTDDEVKNYFLQNSGQKTCGRFRNDQLAEPKTLQELLSRPIPFWKKFLAILCIVFGSCLSGCQNTKTDNIKLDTITLGEIAPEYIPSEIRPTEIKPDTTFIQEVPVCTSIGTTVVIPDIVEPLLVEDVGIGMIEKREVNPDTMFFTGGIKVDTIKKVDPVLPKVDSVKKIPGSNICDTSLRKPIEP